MDSRLHAFAQWMISEWNGRTVGRTTGYALNFDRRFGNQCMDLWNWTWTFLGIPSTAIKRTYDAAGVWELPTTDPIWEYFDGILPHETFHPGDTFVYNRNAFGAQGRGAGNGYGHIGMVVKDFGNGTFQVLEANGLGDGYEDEYLNQFGSPARLHTWSKADLYGVLRPIPSKCLGLSNFGGSASIMPTSNTPTPEEGFLMALTSKQQEDIYWILCTEDGRQHLADLVGKGAADKTLNTPIRRGGVAQGETSLAAMVGWNDDHVARTLSAVAAAAASDGATVDEIQKAVQNALAEGVIKVDVTVEGAK